MDFKIDTTRNQLLTGTITRQVTDITLRTRITNLTASTKNAYWNLLAAIRAIEAAKQSLALAEKLIEDNRVRVEVGTLAPMDVVSAQAEAATRRQTLTQAEATRRTAELLFKRLIVGETNDPVWRASIEPIDVVQVRPITIDLEGAVTTALGQRTDLLTAKKIYNPLTLDIGDEVNVDRISGSGVTIYPGCRIYGEKTVISAGTTLGKEGPVTIDNCQLGPAVELKARYFNKSVFFQKANMASGAHVRADAALEERISSTNF